MLNLKERYKYSCLNKNISFWCRMSFVPWNNDNNWKYFILIFWSKLVISGKQLMWSVFHSRGLFSGKRKMDSRFFHYKFPFSRSHLVWKIENLVTDLPPRLRLGWQDCHSILIFQTRRLLENRTIIVSKPFVHTKFDKKQNTIVRFSSYTMANWFFIKEMLMISLHFSLVWRSKIGVLCKILPIGMRSWSWSRMWVASCPLIKPSWLSSTLSKASWPKPSPSKSCPNIKTCKGARQFLSSS